MTGGEQRRELVRPVGVGIAVTAAGWRGRTTALVRVAVGTIGIGLISLGVVIVVAGIAELITKGGLSRGGPMGMLLCAAAGLGGVSLVRWGFGRPGRFTGSATAPSALLAAARHRLLAVAMLTAVG